ncbi:unnamed protein product [Leuciscus chuanchicus]
MLKLKSQTNRLVTSSDNYIALSVSPADILIFRSTNQALPHGGGHLSENPYLLLLTLISPKDSNLFGYSEFCHPECSMWLTLAALLTLCATGRSAENSSESSAVEEKLLIARGKLMAPSVVG